MSKKHNTEQKIDTKVKHLQLLRKIDQAILNSAGELDKTFTAILNGIVDLTGSNYADLALVHKDHLVIKASTDPDPSALGMKLPSILGILQKKPDINQCSPNKWEAK